MRKNKLLLLLALLMTAATGAWADTTVTWSASDMSQIYIDFDEGTAQNNTIKGITATGSTGGDGRWDGDDISAMNAINTITFTSSVGNIKSIAIKAESISLYPQGGWTLSDENKKLSWSGEASSTVSLTLSAWDEIDNISEIVFTIESAPAPAAATYTVSMKDGVKDADKWTVKVGEGQAQALPIGGLKGDGSETVTLKYTGRLKVKGVTATSEAAAPSVPDGAINGKFSVSDGKQVYFSKGNLRYASSKWSFFDNQYDYYTSHSADAWDHFGWSTSATTYGMSTSSNNDDYSGDFVDWGATMGAGWRTLTSDEWAYLLKTRSASTVNGTENGRYAKAKVNDVGGVILFPDTYTHPDGVAAPTGVNATDEYGWEGNSYTAADWTKMESAGCVFLPAAGCRYGSEMIGLGSYGYYGSATPDGADYAYRVKFNSGSLEPANSINRCLGCSVRLVQEATSDEKPAEATPALSITSPSVGQVIGSDGKNYAYGSLPTGVTAVAKICYVSGSNGLALALADEGKMEWSTAIETCAAHTAPFTGGTWKLATKDEWDNMIYAAGSYSALHDGFSSVGGTNMQSDFYWSSTEYDSDFAWYYDDYNQEDWDNGDKIYGLYVRACLAFTIEQSAKPAATVTTAPTGAEIVGVGKTTALVSGGVADGGTLMYAVTTTNTKPTSTDGFSATVPTAETITASGTVYVWYYVKGDDTHSDSEIAATAIEVPVADIVWDVTNISSLRVMGTFESYAREGVTLSGNAEQIVARWRDKGDPTTSGIQFDAMESGGYTFTAPTGKKFTKIVMTLTFFAGWDNANLGSGWSYSGDDMTEIYKVTWTGTAASTVGLLTGADNFSGERVKSIVFYLSE